MRLAAGASLRASSSPERAAAPRPMEILLGMSRYRPTPLKSRIP